MVRRASWFTVGVVLAGGAAAGARAEEPFRAHPDLKQRLAAVRTVAVVVPDLRAFEVMRNDQPMFHAAWTDLSRENVTAALERKLQARGLVTARVRATPETEPLLQEVAPMYRAVLSAILQATYSNRFAAPGERFDYTLGDLSALAPEADAFVLVWGLGVTSSGGRRAFQLLLGSGSFGLDRLVVALVARSGEVLWFDPVVSTGYDLRDPVSAEAFVYSALRYLPEAAP